jgi:hypothetical protein
MKVLTIRLSIDFPQLNKLGGTLMGLLDPITTALNSLDDTLTQELAEIAAALQTTGGPSQDEIDQVVSRVNALRDKIAGIIP